MKIIDYIRPIAYVINKVVSYLRNTIETVVSNLRNTIQKAERRINTPEIPGKPKSNLILHCENNPDAQTHSCMVIGTEFS